MRTIPEEDAAVLRALCRIGDDDQIPTPVEQKYWHFKRIRDVLCAGGVHPDALALIVLLTGHIDPPAIEAAPFNPRFEFEQRRLKEGDTVEVKWRNRQLPAIFKQATIRDTCIVVLDGESQDKEIKNENVLGILAQV